MTTEELFLEKWKELEAATRLAFPKWDGKEVEKFLKRMRVEGLDVTRLMSLRMIRNAFSHGMKWDGRPLVTLNPDVIPFLDDVIARIKTLPTAMSIMIGSGEVFSCSLDDKISSVVGTMLNKVYSHVPVLDGSGTVVGAFSESTMLEMSNAGIVADGATTVRAAREFLPLGKHVAEVFRFVSKDDPIASLRSLCAEALEKHERIGMIFVTDAGNPDEPLLGILTVWDIAGVADSNANNCDSAAKE